MFVFALQMNYISLNLEFIEIKTRALDNDIYTKQLPPEFDNARTFTTIEEEKMQRFILKFQ